MLHLCMGFDNLNLTLNEWKNSQAVNKILNEPEHNRTKLPLRPAKTQVSLGICLV